ENQFLLIGCSSPLVKINKTWLLQFAHLFEAWRKFKRQLHHFIGIPFGHESIYMVTWMNMDSNSNLIRAVAQISQTAGHLNGGIRTGCCWHQSLRLGLIFFAAGVTVGRLLWI